MARAKVVLDSSVVIKWFSTENDSDKAGSLRKLILRDNIEAFAPDLQIYEIANALRYNPKDGRTSIKEAVSSVLDVGVQVTVPTTDMVERAVQLSLQFNVSVYDACFLALAEITGSVLITADEKMYSKVSRLPYVKRLSAVAT